MKKSLILRGAFSIWKYPLFLFAYNQTISELIRCDIGRRFRKPSDSISTFEVFCRVLQDKNVASIFLARLKNRAIIYRVLSFFFKSNKNIEILTPPNRIGSGLVIFHNLGAIIRSKSIGEDVTISQGVTIGAGGGYNNTDPDNIPTIGNNVQIGTNAIVIGNITVGDNSIIGAGAVITKDVPNGVVVVGNPQKVIKYSIDCI